MNTTSEVFLLIDDDDSFRKRLSRALKDRSYDVFDTGSPVEGIKLAAEINPTHIVLDLKMPGMTGLMVLKEIKKICKDAAILILTGYGSITTAIEAIRDGAVHYLNKPVDLDTILQSFKGAADTPKQYTVPSLDRIEWEHLQRVMQECNGNISLAAKMLGLHRRSLQRKLKNPPRI